MANGSDGAVLRQVNRLFGPGTVAGLSEGDLLERFVARRDEAAFEALVARHGPMVLGVCRRALRDPHDADDAFQATFLILARRAGAIRDREILARWLFGVARRVSARARVLAGRRRDRERPASEELAGPVIDPADGELRAILDEEVGRLPDRYRSPVVLCYLEGRSHEEAARQLGWPVGTVKGRLSRARDLLRSRLTRRGLTASAATLAMAAVREASAAVPEPLIQSTTRTALIYVAGGATAGMLPAASAALAGATLRAMAMTKLKALSAAVLAVGFAAGGAGVIAQVGKAGDEAPGAKAAEVVVGVKDTPANRDDRSAIQGRWQLITLEVGGKPEAPPERGPTLITRDQIIPPAPVPPAPSPAGVRYTLDASRDPTTIDFINPNGPDISDPDLGGPILGIYRLKGDHLTLCLGSPGKPRPTAFTTESGSQTRLLSLRRLEPAPDGAPAIEGRADTPAAPGLAEAGTDANPGVSRPEPHRVIGTRTPRESEPADVARTSTLELEVRLKHALRSLQRKEALAKTQAISRHDVLEAADEVENLQAQARGMHQATSDELEILQARLAAKEAELQQAAADVQLAKAMTANLKELRTRNPDSVSSVETLKAEVQAELAEARRKVREEEGREAAIRVKHAKRRVAELARLLDPKVPPAPDAPAPLPSGQPGPGSEPKAEADPKDRAVLDQLDRKVDLTLERVDFWDAIEAIQMAAGGGAERGFAFLFNHEELADPDATKHAKINLAVRGVSAGTALRLTLGQLGLTYRVEGGLVKFVGKPSAPRVDRPRSR